MPFIDAEAIKELVEYDPVAGTFRNKKSNRILVPERDSGMIGVHSKAMNLKVNIKPEKLAWLITHGYLPTQYNRILHKNLKKDDNRLCNLALVHRKEYQEISEAHRNLMEFLRIVPHPEDKYSYFLEYKSKGALVRELVRDIVVARKKLKEMQLQNAKILLKHCIFD